MKQLDVDVRPPANIMTLGWPLLTVHTKYDIKRAIKRSWFGCINFELLLNFCRPLTSIQREHPALFFIWGSTKRRISSRLEMFLPLFPNNNPFWQYPYIFPTNPLVSLVVCWLVYACNAKTVEPRNFMLGVTVLHWSRLMCNRLNILWHARLTLS